VRRVLRLLCLSLLAVSLGRAAAPTWHLEAQVYSFHEHTSEVDLHNTTPGLGVMRRHDDWLQGVGVFRNSVGRWAGYGYVGWQKRIGPVRVGGIAGLTHHYNFNHGNIVPLGAAVVTVPVTPSLAIDLVGIPHLRNATYSTLNVSLAWRFR
jgi:hypothetical protein